MKTALLLVLAVASFCAIRLVGAEVGVRSFPVASDGRDYVGRVTFVTESAPNDRITMSSALIFFRRDYLASTTEKVGGWEFRLNLEDGSTSLRGRDGSLVKVASTSVFFYDDRHDRFAKIDDGFSFGEFAPDEGRMSEFIRQCATRIRLIDESNGKTAQPGATDNPGDAQ